MFRDKNGHVSSTKVMSFIGFISFILVTLYVLYACPDKFDYTLFGAITGAGSVSSRVIDKYLNIRAQGGSK